MVPVPTAGPRRTVGGRCRASSPRPGALPGALPGASQSTARFPTGARWCTGRFDHDENGPRVVFGEPVDGDSVVAENRPGATRCAGNGRQQFHFAPPLPPERVGYDLAGDRPAAAGGPAVVGTLRVSPKPLAGEHRALFGRHAARTFKKSEATAVNAG